MLNCVMLQGIGFLGTGWRNFFLFLFRMRTVRNKIISDMMMDKRISPSPIIIYNTQSTCHTVQNLPYRNLPDLFQFQNGTSASSARKSRHMTQKELSEAAGIDQSDISKIETGNANPSLSTLIRLAEGMDMLLHLGILNFTML